MCCFIMTIYGMSIYCKFAGGCSCVIGFRQDCERSSTGPSACVHLFWAISHKKVHGRKGSICSRHKESSTCAFVLFYAHQELSEQTSHVRATTTTLSRTHHMEASHAMCLSECMAFGFRLFLRTWPPPRKAALACVKL